jgi:hypothetical protein
MIHPAAPPAPSRPLVFCALDRHLGPFERLPELGGLLGSDWYRCAACRSPLTLHTVLAQRSAA